MGYTKCTHTSGSSTGRHSTIAPMQARTRQNYQHGAPMTTPMAPTPATGARYNQGNTPMRASIGTPHPMQAQTIYPTNAYTGGGSAAQGGYQADFQERAATPTQLNGQRMATPIQPDGQRVGEMNAHAASFEPSVAPGGRPHEEANEAGAQPAAPRPQPTTHHQEQIEALKIQLAQAQAQMRAMWDADTMPGVSRGFGFGGGGGGRGHGNDERDRESKQSMPNTKELEAHMTDLEPEGVASWILRLGGALVHHNSIVGRIISMSAQHQTHETMAQAREQPGFDKGDSFLARVILAVLNNGSVYVKNLHGAIEAEQRSSGRNAYESGFELMRMIRDHASMKDSSEIEAAEERFKDAHDARAAPHAMQRGRP